MFCLVYLFFAIVRYASFINYLNLVSIFFFLSFSYDWICLFTICNTVYHPAFKTMFLDQIFFWFFSLVNQQNIHTWEYFSSLWWLVHTCEMLEGGLIFNNWIIFQEECFSCLLWTNMRSFFFSFICYSNLALDNIKHVEKET